MRGLKTYAAFAVVCAIFGTTFLAIKVGVEAGAPPFLFAGIRFAFAGLALGLVLLLGGRTTLRRMLELAPRAALVSVLYITASFGATFWAERSIDSATAAQINAVSPIVIAALSFLFLKKRLGLLHWAGIIAGFAGVWLIVSGSLGGFSASGGDARLAASIVMVAGVVAFSAAQVLYRRLFGADDDPFAINSLNMLSGGIGLLLLSLVFERRPFPLEAPVLLSLAYLIVFGSLVGHSLNLWLVERAGPLFASSWSYVSPAIATVAGAVIMGERIGALSVAGMAATLAGVALIARAERQSANEKKT